MDEQPTTTPEITSGVPEGTELQGPESTEIVVYDRDENGGVIGWHKEVKGQA